MLERGFAPTHPRFEYEITALWIAAGAIVGLTPGWVLRTFLQPLLVGMILSTAAGLIHSQRD